MQNEAAMCHLDSTLKFVEKLSDTWRLMFHSQYLLHDHVVGEYMNVT